GLWFPPPVTFLPGGFLACGFWICDFPGLRQYGFTELRQARSLLLALPLQGNAFLEGQRLLRRSIPRLVVVIGSLIVVGGFRCWCIAGLDCLMGCGVCLLPPADAGRDRLLGGCLLLLDALRGGLDGV